MPTDQYRINVTWGNREDALSQCAECLARTLEDLFHLEPSLNTWYELGFNRKKALQKFITASDAQELLRLLEASQQAQIRASGNRKLGASLALWTGQSDTESSRLSVICGLTAGDINTPLRNSINIVLPASGAVRERMKDVNWLAAVLGKLVERWRPDKGGIYSSFQTARQRNMEGNWISWVSFIAGPPDRLQAAIGESAEVIPLENWGSLLRALQEPFNYKNEDHWRILESLQQAVLRSGLDQFSINAKFPLAC